MYSNFFCKVPFEYVHIDDTGNCFLCCPASLPLSIGNLNKNSFMEVWNSSIAQSIRQSILDGSFFYCIKNNCFFFNGGGKFINKNKVIDPFFKKIISESKTHLPVGPKELIAAYDPSCNLSCPSCRKKAIFLRGKELDYAKNIHDNVFKEALHNVKRLILSGIGEPFVSKIYRSAMEKFNFKKFPDMKISLVSNGIFFTPKNWELINKCHGVIDVVSISINAARPETYRINQRGGAFQKLLKNLKFIKSLRKKNIINFFGINFFVQQNNFREMKEFIDLGKKIGVDRIFFTHLVNWGVYSDKKFRKIAVHHKEHPEYHDFLNILKDPVFKEPDVFLSNLYSYLPDNILSDKHENYVSELSEDEFININYKFFKQLLKLNTSQSENALDILNKMKDEFLNISLLKTASNKPSPLNYIGQFIKNKPVFDPPLIIEELITYASREIEKESGLHYTELYNKIQYIGKLELVKLLNTNQKKIFSSLSIYDFIGIETGYDPFGSVLDHFFK